MKPAPAALVLLLLGLAWNNAWKWAPEEHQGRIFTAGSGLFIAVLLSALMVVTSARSMQVVCALLIGFALQVFGCNAWFIVAPWPVVPGAELCSSRLGVPLGMVGLWATTMVVQHLYLRGGHGHR